MEVRFGATESSRSRISASAAESSAFASFRSLSPGTKSNDRNGIRTLMEAVSVIRAWRRRPCASSGRTRQTKHERAALARTNEFVPLVEAAMLEYHDAVGGPRLAFALLEHPSLHVNRVTGKHRLGESDFIPAKIADRRPERRVPHRNADHQAEGKGAVHQGPTEFGASGIFGVNMYRRRIVCHRTEQDIVSLCDGPADVMPKGLAQLELFVIKARHQLSPATVTLMVATDRSTNLPLTDIIVNKFTKQGSRPHATHAAPASTPGGPSERDTARGALQDRRGAAAGAARGRIPGAERIPLGGTGNARLGECSGQLLGPRTGGRRHAIICGGHRRRIA